MNSFMGKDSIIGIAGQTAGGNSVSRWLLAILLLSIILRLGLAVYLGDDTNNWLGARPIRPLMTIWPCGC